MAATNALLAFGGMTQRWREDIRVEPPLHEKADLVRERGIHIQEGCTAFLTTAHDDADLAKIVEAFDAASAQMMAAASSDENRNRPGRAKASSQKASLISERSRCRAGRSIVPPERPPSSYISESAIQTKRKAFIRKWRLKCPAVAASPMEIDPNIECNRTIARAVQATDQDADPSAVGGNRRDVVLGTAGCGQITMRKVDGWQSLIQEVMSQDSQNASVTDVFKERSDH